MTHEASELARESQGMANKWRQLSAKRKGSNRKSTPMTVSSFNDISSRNAQVIPRPVKRVETALWIYSECVEQTSHEARIMGN